MNKIVAAMKAAIDKEFKGASVRVLADGAASASREVIPTGIDVLDNWVFSKGGIPGNKIGEVFGDSDSGKTSLILTFLGAAQRAGGMGLLLETENTLEADRAKIFGCNLDDILLAEPECADDVIEQIMILLDQIPSGIGPNVIAWDSLASAPSKATSLGKGDVGGIARLMSKKIPVISKRLADKRAAIVIINQIRYKVGVMFGDPTTTPGGEALKFMASWRLRTRLGTMFKRGEDVIGQQTKITLKKSKSTAPHRKAVLKLDHSTGWDNVWTTINFAKDQKLISEGARVSAKTYDLAIEALNTYEGWRNYKPTTEVETTEQPEAVEPAKEKEGQHDEMGQATRTRKRSRKLD